MFLHTWGTYSYIYCMSLHTWGPYSYICSSIHEGNIAILMSLHTWGPYSYICHGDQLDCECSKPVLPLDGNGQWWKLFCCLQQLMHCLYKFNYVWCARRTGTGACSSDHEGWRLGCLCKYCCTWWANCVLVCSWATFVCHTVCVAKCIIKQKLSALCVWPIVGHHCKCLWSKYVEVYRVLECVLLSLTPWPS